MDEMELKNSISRNRDKIESQNEEKFGVIYLKTQCNFNSIKIIMKTIF